MSIIFFFLLFTDNTNFDSFSAYEVGDVMKLYFRELPEPLMTSKLSELLIVIMESKCTCLVMYF